MLSLTPPRHISTLRDADDRCRRIADVAGRGLGRLNWAGKRTYKRRQGRRGVRPKRASVEGAAVQTPQTCDAGQNRGPDTSL